MKNKRKRIEEQGEIQIKALEKRIKKKTNTHDAFERQIKLRVDTDIFKEWKKPKESIRKEKKYS